MAFIEEITLGRYVPKDSPLHRLDPRLKLLGFPLLVVAAFSGGGAGRLCLLAPLALMLLLLSKIEARLWWRGLWVMRWLFLFTVALHLLLTPGRTLLGIPWLSLDGLLLGLLLCGRLMLAILFSSLLTLTTSPLDLAGALSRFLSPLRRLGLAVDEWILLLLLVLHFIPVLREEAMDLALRRREEGLGLDGRSVLERARLLAGMAAPLLLRLVERADALAHAAAAGEALVPEGEGGGLRLRPLGGHEAFVAFFGIIFLVFLYMVT